MQNIKIYQNSVVALINKILFLFLGKKKEKYAHTSVMGGFILNQEQLIEENIPLLKSIASNFYNVPFEDLLQSGKLGILKALKKYRNNGTIKFSTYAYNYIFGEMYEFLMKERKIKVSKEMLRLSKKIELTQNALSEKIGRTPTYEEIGQFLGMTPFEVMEALSINSETLSLDKNDEETRNLYETIPIEEGLSLDEKLTLKDGINSLPEMEQKILQYRYFEDMTQQETAKKMGKTQVMISRYETKSLKLLREYLEVA